MSVLMPNAENDYYWNLTLKDGRVVAIPPSGVEIVNRKMASREPVRTSNETIPFSEIKGFEKSSRRFTDVKLLVETARAFDEPVITEAGEVKARWVKKTVTRNEYERKYAKDGWYRSIGTDGDMIVIAFILPVHKINPEVHSYCTPEEERKLG